MDDKIIPSCFISYAWDNNSRIKIFCECLRDCLTIYNIDVKWDVQDNSEVGSNIDKFINNIMHSDYVIVIISNKYLEKINNCETKVYQEWRLILKLIKLE